MNHDPHRLPSGHRWIGGKAGHLSSGVEGHLYCMKGCSCLCEVVRVLLPSANHVGVGLKEGLNGPKSPTYEQV